MFFYRKCFGEIKFSRNVIASGSDSNKRIEIDAPVFYTTKQTPASVIKISSIKCYDFHSLLKKNAPEKRFIAKIIRFAILLILAQEHEYLDYYSYICMYFGVRIIKFVILTP